MAEVRIQETVWQPFVAVARRQKKRAQALVETVLQDYVQRQADEELLRRSERAARRTRFRQSESEEIVRRHRRRAKKA
jgi:hypothetical protein